jgi:hypothetical protein
METWYRSSPWVSGILKAVAPVCRAQGKSHWAFAAQGFVLSTAPPTPVRSSLTVEMEGEAHPQSVIALPDSDRITQLISTAPPSISTHAIDRDESNRRTAVGFM